MPAMVDDPSPELLSRLVALAIASSGVWVDDDEDGAEQANDCDEVESGTSARRDAQRAA
jgi:hypothetical protein